MSEDQKQGGCFVAKKQAKPDSGAVEQKKMVPKFGEATHQFMEYLSNSQHGCGM